ncbi:MAG: sulfatase-like hydrolase/transferase [Dokdonella sp.]|nr:sulfatase-like hydrolase/transferase [Dokdonella sp.]
MPDPALPMTTPAAARRRWRDGLVLGASVAILILAVVLLDPGVGGSQATPLGLLRTWSLNILPALGLFAVLLALSRRALLSAWLVLLVLAGLHGANQAKLGTLQTPLLPADFRLFAEPGPAIALLSQYVHMGALRWLLALLAIGFTVLLVLRERRLALLAGWRAPVLGAFALVLIGTLTAGATPWQRVYDQYALGFQPWALTKSSARTGLIGNLLLYKWQVGGGDIPAGDHAAAARFLQHHPPALQAALAAREGGAALPDIVVVQSESLFDPARLRDVPEGRWLPEYHRLSRRATAGNLRVPTFVGGTIRTEFEMLTGTPLASLGPIQYPWLELADADYPNLVRLLGTHGYTRTAIHPNAAAFWNRDRTYPALGFDRFIDSSEFDQERIVGLFLSDAAMTDRILAQLDGADAPQFVFAISMENHGPFDWRPNLDAERLAALPMPDRLDAGGKLWFGNYLYLLDDADHELGRLADALRQRQRRTLLLFYGDHLPGLAPVYFQLGFKDGRDAKEQPVPWLLLDTANPRPLTLDTHSWMLPGLLLEAAGIQDGAWFDLVAALARDPGFDPGDEATVAGLLALARLQLHGELEPLLQQMAGSAAAMPEPLAQAHHAAR